MYVKKKKDEAVHKGKPQWLCIKINHRTSKSTPWLYLGVLFRDVKHGILIFFTQVDISYRGDTAEYFQVHAPQTDCLGFNSSAAICQVVWPWTGCSHSVLQYPLFRKGGK